MNERNERNERADEELLSLPYPPRGERTRTLTLLSLTACASLCMAFALRNDAAFALSDSAVTHVGELHSARVDDIAKSKGAVSQLMVQGHALLAATDGIKYERPFVSDSYRIAPVAGRADADIWVTFRIAEGSEGERFVPPATFTGRLVRFENAGLRYRSLESAIAKTNGVHIPKNAWLLVDAETPTQMRWAMALMVVFASFGVWNIITIAHLSRRIEGAP